MSTNLGERQGMMEESSAAESAYAANHKHRSELEANGRSELDAPPAVHEMLVPNVNRVVEKG